MGKQVVKGTRLAVDFILGPFAAGWSEQQVLESYPQLTPEALRADFAFAAEYVRDESLFLPRSAEEPAERLLALPSQPDFVLNGRLTVIEREQACAALRPLQEFAYEASGHGVEGGIRP